MNRSALQAFTVPPGYAFLCGRDKRVTPLENRVFEKGELHRQRVKFSKVGRYSHAHSAGGPLIPGGLGCTDRIGPSQPTCRNQIQKAQGAKLNHARPQPWRQCGKMESFGIASDHFSFSRMRGARSLRRQHRAAHVLTPGGHRIPGAPWRRYRLGVTQRFSGILSPENFQGGGGPSKVCEFQGRLPHGVSRADFFSWSETFDYFSRNQRFQMRQRSVVQVDRESVQWLAPGVPPPSATQLHSRGEYFSGTPEAPGASQSSLRSHGRPRGKHTRFFAKFRKTFFGQRDARKNAAKFRVGGGG